MAKGYQVHRRSFLQTSAMAGVAGAALAGGLGDRAAADRSIPKGDIDILRFLSALEQIESDLWEQYNEIYGIQDKEVPGGTGNSTYTAALQQLDMDMPQYVHDNTDDEFSHHAFLNAFLASIDPKLRVDLSPFATIPGSSAPGSSGKKRLTNLMKLRVDTSWWTRYRDPNHNPDLDGFSVFANAVPDLMPKDPKKSFPAIPRNSSDLPPGAPANHIQAIANTAGFHFGFIEQGGTSLYPTLALRVTHPEVLRILLSIGPSETMHFQTWQDKAGNAPAITDPTNGLTFPPLASSSDELLKANLIMPEPCPFLDRTKFPVAVSIIRPVSTDPKIFGAMAAVNGFIADGLFNGQTSQAFFNLLNDLAAKADAAKRLG
jgi:hypothetical protein